MNAHTFGTHPPTCPICHQTGAAKPHKLITGLLTCQHCRGRLVVSWSGHYVRDPFTQKQSLREAMLRRESHPIARLRRDARLVATHPIVMMTVGSALFLGFCTALLPNPLPGPRAQSIDSSLNLEKLVDPSP